MALWFNLKINSERIGGVEIRRNEPLDISDPAAVAHVWSTYDVFRDDQFIGQVRHQYGHGAWKLLALASSLIASTDAQPTPPVHLFGPDAHGQPGYGLFPDSCGWPNEQCIGHAPRMATAPNGSTFDRVPSRVQARDEPCADPANCDVHRATTAPKAWTCACGYMNSGGICTHCGALSGEPIGVHGSDGSLAYADDPMPTNVQPLGTAPYAERPGGETR